MLFYQHYFLIEQGNIHRIREMARIYVRLDFEFKGISKVTMSTGVKMSGFIFQLN